MKLFGKDLDSDLVFIAEIGVNHEGDVEAASRMLRLAAEAGADAVKLQSYTPDRYASSADPARLERVGRFALDEAAHRRLMAEAKALGVALFSTPLTEDWVPRLDALGVAAFKIASGDLTFEPAVRAAARTGKPVILSTGAGDLEEIDRAVSWVREEVGAGALSDRLVLMQCISAYPTPSEQANVGVLRSFAERYGVPVGYSNHVIGPQACYAAIALGASVIEAHFTDCKTGRDFRDHSLSMEAEDLRSLIAMGKAIRASVGDGVKRVQPEEEAIRQAIRKGVVAARPLPAGTLLTRDDLMFARPATGFPADRVDTLVGRRLAVGLDTGGQLTPDVLAPALSTPTVPTSTVPTDEEH